MEESVGNRRHGRNVLLIAIVPMMALISFSFFRLNSIYGSTGLKAHLSHSYNLQAGSRVLIDGEESGFVSSVRPDPERAGFEVSIVLKRGHAPVPKDAFVMVSVDGVLGPPQIVIHKQGAQGSIVEDGDVLVAREAGEVDLTPLRDAIQEAIDDSR